MIEIGYVLKTSASAVISSLSMAINGRNTGSDVAEEITDMFSRFATPPVRRPRRWRGLRACSMRETLGNAKHHPAIHHDERTRHRQCDLSLQFPEWHEDSRVRSW